MTSNRVADLFEQAGVRLFARNVRGFLGSTEINRSMETTLKNKPEYFWYYNNGITVICDDAERVSKQGRSILRVTNPQVINGQQTTRTLSKMAGKTSQASVTVRVIRVPRDDQSKSNDFDVLVSHIVAATNWQNAILPSDLISNDRRQIDIERQLRKLNYWYVRKRQTKSEAKRSSGSQRYIMVRKDDLARAVAGCEFDPAIVRAGKENLFEERMYGQVFPTSDPYYYLCRYWLMTTVSYAARGYPERAYAKWLVLNFMWSRISPLVKTKSMIEKFRVAWETNSDALYYLWKANTIIFKTALQFYRSKRGAGAKAKDVSNFFKRKGMHKAFEKYWSSSNNTNRPAFSKALKKFDGYLTKDV